MLTPPLQNTPEFVAAVNTRDPKARFQRVWNCCKNKTSCSNDVPKNDDQEYEPGGKPKQTGHGGCGNVQPKVRQTALQLWATQKSTSEDGTKNTDKRLITPEMALNILKNISDSDLGDMVSIPSGLVRNG